MIAYPAIRGQQKLFLNTDTVEIGDVSVFSRSPDGKEGYRVTAIEKDKLKEFSGSSLSELLEKNSTLVIKNWGNGGLSTSSFRGMGASHTRVFWAGIPVNPPASGQVDLSLVPVTFSGNVKIYHGASPAGNGTGGPGGSISLNSLPDWKTGTDILFRQGVGSFGYISDDISIVTGSASWQLITGSYLKKSDNDFSYNDITSSSDDATLIRTNNSFRMMGVTQELFVKTGKSVISARYWYNRADRELPGPVIATESNGENQKDKQLWLTAGIKNYSFPFSLDMRGAYMTDLIEYENPGAGILSTTRSSNIYLFGSGKYSISKQSSLDISLSDKFSSVNSVNHNGVKNSNHAVLRTEYSYSSNHRIGLLVIAEMNYSGKKLYAPLPSAGIDFRLSEAGLIYLKGNIGASISIPTLNDLYWVPGGNPDLVNETGINSELTFEKSARSGSGIITSWEISIYNSRLWNMIKWMPGDNGIWSPDNIAEVNSSGAEADTRLEIRNPHSVTAIGISYSYNRVVNMVPASEADATTGKQLPYVPYHKANADLRFTSGGFTVNWFTGITGIRFTTADNSDYLPGYIVNDLSMKYSKRFKGVGISTSLSINNIFNVSYEQIAYYPMPGRNYKLTVDFNFGKRK